MKQTDEYLRRNLLVAKAQGARSFVLATQRRLFDMKSSPKWLRDNILEIIVRLEPIPRELAQHRDEAKR